MGIRHRRRLSSLPAEHDPVSTPYARRRRGLVGLGTLVLAAALMVTACAKDSNDDIAVAANTVLPSAATDSTAAATGPDSSGLTRVSPVTTRPTPSSAPDSSGLATASPAITATTASTAPVDPSLGGEVDPRLEADIKQIAEDSGWTLAEARAHVVGGEAAGWVATHVAAQHPDQFVGGVMPDDPNDPPELYIKGVAGPDIRALVAASPVEIRIVDGQPYSLDELGERQRRVADALVAQGFAVLAVGFDLTAGGVIEAAVTSTPDARSDTVEEVVAGLPADLREHVVLRIEVAPRPLDPDDPYGPMAVYPGNAGGLSNGGTGTLEITDECVLFHSDAADWGTMLLVWGNLQAQWVPDERLINFDNEVEPPLLLRTGDRIGIGGAGLGVLDPDTGQIIGGPVSDEPRPFVWLSAPAAACQGYALWSVSIVDRVP